MYSGVEVRFFDLVGEANRTYSLVNTLSAPFGFKRLAYRTLYGIGI